MENHAVLSASGSKKWINCPGSITLEKDFPNESSEYAQEGTNAHRLAELKLLYAFNVISRADMAKEAQKIEIDEEMDKYTTEYKDFIMERYNSIFQSICQKYNKKEVISDLVEIFIEKKVDYSAYAPQGFGTADAIIISNGIMEIFDFKYGKGVLVNAENNSQMMLYALGALEEYDYLYDIKTVTMTIYQPRKDNISSFELPAQKLYEWGNSIKPIAEKAFYGTSECHAGKHCIDGFCRATPKCRAFAEKMKSVQNDKLITTLSNDEIAEILEVSEMLSKWAKKVKEYATQQALQGVDFTGFKLVEGRKSRQYNISDDEVIQILSNYGYSDDMIFKKSLRTVADMEKVLSQDFNTLLGRYIEVKPGAPTLVPIDDKRPIFNSAESDFKNIETF